MKYEKLNLNTQSQRNMDGRTFFIFFSKGGGRGGGQFSESHYSHFSPFLLTTSETVKIFSNQAKQKRSKALALAHAQ